MKKRTAIFGITLLLILALASPVLAQEEIEITGTVLSVGETSFEVETEAGVYTVMPPDDYDLADLQVGDLVEVEGDLEGDVITAFKIMIETEEEEEMEEENGEEEDDRSGSFFCQNPDISHPALSRIASRYEADYQEVLGYFCESNYGIGEIMLAFATSKVLEDGSEVMDILGQKTEMGGWGQVWRSLDLIGPPPHAGRPEHAGPPEWVGK